MHRTAIDRKLPREDILLYCIVTASMPEISQGDLDRFLQSAMHPSVRVVLVLRSVPEAVRADYMAREHVLAAIDAPDCGLSRARNIGLDYLSRTVLRSEDIVSFPDDDCVYPLGLIDEVLVTFRNTTAELLIGSYGENAIPSAPLRPLNFSIAALKSPSVAMFITWGLLVRVGAFNEGLGVGSSNFNYGEDNDFAIRAFQVTDKSFWKPSLRVWHLEDRPMFGRNSKGYLTCCILNWRDYRVWGLLLSGVVKAPVKDLLSLDVSLSACRNVWRAFDVKRLKKARVAREMALGFFDSYSQSGIL